MRLSMKHEQGLEAACDILSDVAKWGYDAESERLNLAYDTLSELLDSSREQRAKERQKRAFERREKERAKERETPCL